MSSSGGSFRAAEAFVKSFVIDGDSVTFDRTALEGLRVRSSSTQTRPCTARACRPTLTSLFPLVPRRTSSCHPGGACAYFRSGRGCRTGTEPSTAVASPPSWTSSQPWRCSPSPKIRASGTFISFHSRMGNLIDAVFCSQRQHIYKLRVTRAGRDGRRGGRPGDQGGQDAGVHGRDVTHEGRRQGGGHRDALQVSAKLADELETLSDRSTRINVVTLTLYELTLIERLVSIRDTPAPSEDAGTCTATCPATAART